MIRLKFIGCVLGKFENVADLFLGKMDNISKNFHRLSDYAVIEEICGYLKTANRKEKKKRHA